MGVLSVVQHVAGRETVKPVWENELGGLTFEVGTGSERRFIKWAPVGSGMDLQAEVARLRWAAAFIRVPLV